MRPTKKLIMAGAIITTVLISLALAGPGCTTESGDAESSQTEATDASQIPPQTAGDRFRGGGFLSGMPLAELAEILGIDQQELEDAFALAQSELAGGDMIAPPAEGEVPDGEMPVPPLEGEIPDGEMPREGGMPGGGPSAVQLPDEILARISEILGIDQQELEDALAAVQSAIPDMPSPEETS